MSPRPARSCLHNLVEPPQFSVDPRLPAGAPALHFSITSPDSRSDTSFLVGAAPARQRPDQGTTHGSGHRPGLINVRLAPRATNLGHVLFASKADASEDRHRRT